MAYTVNLLPWRARRQTRCRNFWSLMFAGTLMVVLLAAFAYRQHLQAELRVMNLIAQTDAELLNAFAKQKVQWLDAQKRRQRLESVEKQRQITRDWQQALTLLAEKIPPGAWLTQLRYQQGRLELAGYAATFDALAQLDAVLKTLPGFHAATAGGAARDSEGRWQFSHQLIKDGADEPLP